MFKLQVVTPDKEFYAGEVSMVELTPTEGQIGVYASHIPLTAMLVPCIVNIKNNGEVKHAAIHDGFIEILKDKVVVLSESCEWPEEIDEKRAQEAKGRAEKRLSGGGAELDVARAELALKRALVRLEARR